MLKVLVLVLVLVGTAVLVVLVLASTKPASFHVERSADIAATPAHVRSFINDFHRWDAWSPWARLDPGMRTTYGGPASGPGATYAWEGNRKVGKGRMEILSETPTTTSIKLDFLSPFESHSVSTFNLAPEGSGTRVTWTMDGPNTLMGKVMNVFASMDSMIGGDFEKGLASLKSAAER